MFIWKPNKPVLWYGVWLFKMTNNVNPTAGFHIYAEEDYFILFHVLEIT